MSKRRDQVSRHGVEPKGAQRATGGSEASRSSSGPLKKGQRWSLKRKRDVVLRILGGESIQVLSRELGVEVYVLEEWRDKALRGMESGLRQRKSDPLRRELEAAMKRIGELTMENELVKEGLGRRDPFQRRRSRK